MTFYITHLYPKEMSIYGDMGNILALSFRLKLMGLTPVYQTVGIGQELPNKTDFYFIGGGQDKEQLVIFKDLLSKKDKLITDIEKGMSLLAICGGYQLLGRKFLTGDGHQIEGIGLFPIETKAPDNSVKSRCIGDLVVECQIPELGGIKLVGFENHGGQTYFTQSNQAYPLGQVVVGFGNNATEKHEGCIYKHAVGTYLHGSCLPKNPELTDWLIASALHEKTDVNIHQKLIKANQIAHQARQVILDRYALMA
jgi:lipid II isoglutaminyl synthase (glutamine-hydrolysing)